MNENCILFNDKKIDLTEEKLKEAGITKEQLKMLGIELDETLEERVRTSESYWTIGLESGKFISFGAHEDNVGVDDRRWGNGNYFANEEDANQATLMLNLQLRLMAFKRRNDPVKEFNWGSCTERKYCIYYNYTQTQFYVEHWQYLYYPGVVYFSCYNLARRAITEVVEPYLKEHPDFKMQ